VRVEAGEYGDMPGNSILDPGEVRASRAAERIDAVAARDHHLASRTNRLVRLGS
jgi:hypothetical protein